MPGGAGEFDVEIPPLVDAAVPDLVGRDFTAQRPGTNFIGDITYIQARQGWVYLATVIEPGAIWHSDSGAHYTSGDFRALVIGLGMRSSIGRTGVCWNNAMAEPFFAALRNERVHRTVYPTKAHARRDVVAYIEGFYNSRRRHSALNNQRPNDVHYSYRHHDTAA